MKNKILKGLGRFFRALALVFSAYLIIGNLFHHLFFPEKPLADELRPRHGFSMRNRFGEKVVFTKTSVEPGGMVEFEFSLTPGGSVPVYHVHDSVAETFQVRKGTLALKLPEGEQTLREGANFTVLANIPHQPRNLSREGAEVTVSYQPGERMDEFLIQFFGLVNDGKTSEDGKPAFLQMMLLGPKFGVYAADVPKPLQKFLSFLLGPFARLVGHKSTYPQYFVRQ